MWWAHVGSSISLFRWFQQKRWDFFHFFIFSWNWNASSLLLLLCKSVNKSIVVLWPPAKSSLCVLQTLLNMKIDFRIGLSEKERKKKSSPICVNAFVLHSLQLDSTEYRCFVVFSSLAFCVTSGRGHTHTGHNGTRRGTAEEAERLSHKDTFGCLELNWNSFWNNKKPLRMHKYYYDANAFQIRHKQRCFRDISSPIGNGDGKWNRRIWKKSFIFCSFVRSTRHHMLLTCDSLCTCCSKHSLFRFFYQTNNDNNNHSGSSKKSEAWLLIESECVAPERKRREWAWAREQSSRTTTSTCHSCLMWIVLSLHKLMYTRILAL